jgi:GxxExxY protein
MTSGKYLYADLTEKIIGAAYNVHNSLGKGLSEKTYENALVVKLGQMGLTVEQQKTLPVFFENQKVGEQIVDLVVEERVLIELKTVSHLLKQHETQILGYLKNTRLQIGLLLNFAASVEVKRLILTEQNK